jgi:hypothetical protein
MSQIGVFMGRDLDPNNESYHFIRLNDWILHNYGSSWSSPPSLSALRRISTRRDKIVRRLKAATSNAQMIRYFGLFRYYQFKQQRFLSSWGWKDPRNTFTAWFWNEVFPDARYIYIVRCGVDAAHSLVTREHQIYRGQNFINRIQKLKRKIFELVTIKFTFADLLPILKRSGFKDSLKCADIKSAFHLWETYTEAAEQFLQTKAEKNRVIRLNYEKLLEQPSNYLKIIANFSGTKVTGEIEQNIISKIDTSRRFSFTKEPHLLEFYENVRESPFMKRYNYNNIHD